MRAGSAAKLIVDALLLRFLPLARRRIDTAQAQVGSSYLFCLSIVTTRYFTVRCCIHEDCFTQTKALCRIGFWDFLCCIQIWIRLFPFWGKLRILTALWPGLKFSDQLLKAAFICNWAYLVWRLCGLGMLIGTESRDLWKLWMWLQDGQYLRASDPAYEQVLDSLAMVAHHTPVPLLEALLKWRERWLVDLCTTCAFDPMSFGANFCLPCAYKSFVGMQWISKGSKWCLNFPKEGKFP